MLSARSATTGTKRVRIFRSELGPRALRDAMPARRTHPPDEGWALELAKTRNALTSEQTALVDHFVRDCLSRPDEEHELLMQADARAVKRAARAIWSSHTGAQSGDRTNYALLIVQFVVAAAVAVFACVLAAARIAVEGRARKPHKSSVTPLMHAEVSTRSRHLLETLAQAHYCGDIIVLGRPQRSLIDFSADVERQFGLRARYFRCFTAGDILRALPHVPHSVAAGVRTAKCHPSNATIAELAGIICRSILGRAARRWWRRTQPATTIAIYAHTGTADTTALERAQQALGTKTVHYAHGVSHGYNFSAISDIGLFQCAHDARWHQRIGGYGECISLRDAPAHLSATSQGGLLVLSNLIHPMNGDYQRTGPALELRFIEIITAALRDLPVRSTPVIWRPHPIFDRQPLSVRKQVIEALAKENFELWPSSRPRHDIQGLALAISTPSTAAIDMLRLGLPTIICAVEPLPAGSVYHQFETVAASPREIAQHLRDAHRLPYLFGETWQRVGPSARPTWKQLSELAGAATGAPQ